MWKSLARGGVAAVLTALVVVTPARAVSAAPFDAAAEAICTTAKGQQQAGFLKRAEDLYASVKVGDARKNCAVTGLKSVAEQRERAAESVIEGQNLIRAGKFTEAEAAFRSALAMDRGNTNASNGIAEALNLQNRPNAIASTVWDRFYRDWGEPLGKMLLFSAVALAILYTLASLSSRLFVGTRTVAWRRNYRWAVGTLGFLLIFSAAVMLPLYAMFKPFTVKGTLTNWVAGMVILFALGVVILAIVASAGKRSDWKHWLALLIFLGVAVVISSSLLLAPRKSPGVQAAGVVAVLGLTGVAVVFVLLSHCPMKIRMWLSISLGVAVLVASSLLLVPLENAGRLIASYVVLTTMGVALTGATLGQNLRLQVEVQNVDGTVSAGSTDYLLARMRGLGTESPEELDRATSVLASMPLSKITSEDLSALPAGKVAGSLSRLFFAIRPDLTWRARVTLVDADRVAMSLSRNGRHVESAVFSRRDLGLAAVSPGLDETEKTAAQNRARAQLLTGAAAFILLHLSEVHVELKDDLYGAERWQSVTLQVIATSRSLIDDSEGSDAARVELLSRAMDEDPQYALARYEYMCMTFKRIPDDQTNYAAFAKSIDEQYDKLGLSTNDNEGSAPLRIRIMYDSATQWLNGYLNETPRRPEMLQRAAESVARLKALCEREWKGKQLRQQAKRMLQFVANLEHCIEVLRGVSPGADATWLHPHEHAASPRLAWDHACLDCFLAELPSQDRVLRLGQAIEDLEFALATNDDRNAATADPCFKPLFSDHRFRRLVGFTPPRQFLDLPTLAPHKIPLSEVGINSALDLERRTRSTEQQDQLAAHLKVSRVVIDQMREVALLAQIDPNLNDPGMLYLLIGQKVSSPAALRERVSRKPRQFVRQLRSQARKDNVHPLGLKRLRARHWLRAARATADGALAP
ncbi:hypothetical protein [Streptomyces sp. Ru71]|uniref:hypothetical protein n=1 Tax=Streptomyces sp. Ru71 TaxID=2080746 RepID=UPI0011AFF2E7|nr:hypothetical protein [Streptomyces sp. Ru71]